MSKIKKAEARLTSSAEAGLAEGEAAMERVLHGRTAQLWALMHQSDRLRVLKSELVAHEMRSGLSTGVWREWAKVPEPRLIHVQSRAQKSSTRGSDGSRFDQGFAGSWRCAPRA